MKIAACKAVAMTSSRNLGSGAVTMNCVPSNPDRKPTIVLASPPMPRMPLDSAS